MFGRETRGTKRATRPPIRRIGKALQDLVDSLRKRRHPEILRRLTEIARLIEREAWDDAVLYAKETAAIALRAKETRLLSKVGRFLEQLGEYDLASQTRYAGGRKKHRRFGRTWNGENIAGQTLLIEQVYDHLGQQLRYACLIGPAARQAKHCIVLAERRLIPLIERTFPGVAVRARDADDAAARAEADYVTNYYDLAAMFGGDAKRIAAVLQPLRPDMDMVRSFQAHYRPGAQGPLVGISWGTQNQEREAPELGAWAGFLSGTPATFVSLQYGKADEALAVLGAMTRAPIIDDRSVDQLIDMDRFAAQMAALDLVVTIDNTIAHTAGALGVPAIVITDDGVSHWPVRYERTPWCPSVVTVRRRRRAWADVLEEVRERVSAALQSGSPPQL